MPDTGNRGTLGSGPIASASTSRDMSGAAGQFTHLLRLLGLASDDTNQLFKKSETMFNIPRRLI